MTREDSKGKRPNSVVVPKREQVKLDEKKATFEQLDKQAEQVSNATHLCVFWLIVFARYSPYTNVLKIKLFLKY